MTPTFAAIIAFCMNCQPALSCRCRKRFAVAVLIGLSVLAFGMAIEMVRELVADSRVEGFKEGYHAYGEKNKTQLEVIRRSQETLLRLRGTETGHDDDGSRLDRPRGDIATVSGGL